MRRLARLGDAFGVCWRDAASGCPVGRLRQRLRGPWHRRRRCAERGAVTGHGLDFDRYRYADGDIGCHGRGRRACCRLCRRFNCERCFALQWLGRDWTDRPRLQRKDLWRSCRATRLRRRARQKLWSAPPRLGLECRDGTGSAAGGARQQRMARYVSVRRGCCISPRASHLGAQRGLRRTGSRHGFAGGIGNGPLLIAGAFFHGPMFLRPVFLQITRLSRRAPDS
jgi:hypothetical protein